MPNLDELTTTTNDYWEGCGGKRYMKYNLLVGETVRLRSGGPLMTIREVRKDSEEYVCTWFSSRFDLHTAVFSENMLSKPQRLISSQISQYLERNAPNWKNWNADEIIAWVVSEGPQFFKGV